MIASKYRDIYDHVFLTNSDYLKAEFSPGYKIALEHSNVIRAAGKRHLDYGCGAGFVVSLLGSKVFEKDSYGIDVSQVALDIANKRGISKDRLFLLNDSTLPFNDNYFDLITCCDVIEHLDLDDIKHLAKELNRILSTSGTLILNISTRLAGSSDINGENLHRTVRDPSFYAEIFGLNRYTVNLVDKDFTAIRNGKFL